MKTFSPRPHDIVRRWYVVDANGAVLGRLASEVAKILRGKHKPIFSPHMDTGDHVVVINARSVRVTGGKETEKTYYRHSGYPGGLREIGYARLLAERPVLAVEKAIRGMLPKNRLGRQMFRKLSVYEGPDHPHQAQKPSALGLGQIPKWEGLPEPKAAPPPEPAPSGQARRRGAPVSTSAERPGRGKPATRAPAKRASAKSGSTRGAPTKTAAAKGRSARGSAPKTSTAKSGTTPRRAAKAGAKSKRAAEPRGSSSGRRAKSKKES